MQRLSAAAKQAPPRLALAAAGNLPEDEQLRAQLAEVQNKNRTLRSTAARLGNALAAVMEARKGPDSAAVAQVVKQLAAVEGSLMSM